MMRAGERIVGPLRRHYNRRTRFNHRGISMPHNQGSRSIGRTSGPSVQAYNTTAKWLHWLIVLMVLAQFTIAILMPDVGPKTVPGVLLDRHFSLGIVILVVMAVRLVYRWRHPVPLDMADSPAWERWTARAVHLAFYFILLVGPFLGWASASAHKLPVKLFGVIALPDIAAPRASWALTAGDIHTLMMWLLLALIVLHAAAALYHHFFWHDGVLRRMLPARSE